MRTTALLLLATGICFAQTPAPKKHAAAPVGWKAVHQSAIVVDTHADTPQDWLDKRSDAADPDSKLMVTLPKAKAGNLGAEFFSIWVDPAKFKGHYPDRTLALIDAVYEQVRHHPDKMMLATSVKDIYTAHREHKLASLMGIEGGHSINNDLGLLRDYYRLGVRYMTLTWSNTNDWADSSGDVNDKSIEHHDGLTDFGRDVVREMNRLGMMVDISHVSDRTFYKTLVVARAPVIASHSSSRAITDVPRNMTDDMLRALARNGGVAMVNFNCGFVSNEYAAAEKKVEAADPSLVEMKKKAEQPGSGITESDLQAAEAKVIAQIPRPPLSALLDHVDHMVKIAGIDHVGLGSDFDGVVCTPQGIDSAADLPKITQGLHDRGYNAEQIRKVLGGNLLRVFTEVEKTAAVIQAESPVNNDTRRELKPASQKP